MSDETNISGADEDGLLVAEYVLGTLTADEHANVGDRLRNEAPLRSHLVFWRRRLGGLDTQFAETTAPAAVWSAIERRLFPDTAKASFWGSLALWRGLTAAA